MLWEIDGETHIWAEEIWGKLERKLEAQCLRLGSMMPYVMKIWERRSLRPGQMGSTAEFCGRCIMRQERNVTERPRRESRCGWMRLSLPI